MTELELLRQRNEQLEASQRQLEAAKQRVEEENRTLRETLDEKELELKLLLERFFGRKSERFIDPDQRLLDFSDSEQVDDAIEGIKQAQEEHETDVAGYTRQRRRPRREKLPEHLPREVATVDLPDQEKEGLTCIGYDSTETLIYTPGELRVLETRYLKYVDPAASEAGVQQPPREPAGLVEGNRYDTGVAAQVITAKYGYHLPVYRQQDLFAGSGWNPSRSTLLNLLTSAATRIRPLIGFFADEVRRDGVIGSDDTGVTLLLPKTIPKVDPLDLKSRRVHEVLSEARKLGKPSTKAKMWAYRGVHVPLKVFDFTVSRHRDGPDLFLIENGYAGTLLGDCYGANVGITMRSCGSIVHAACVSHARRKVREARDHHAEHARLLLAMFQELYRFEDRGRTLDAAGRLELRQREGAAVWDRIRQYLDTKMGNVLPKEAMSKAVGYLRNQWTTLTRYLSNPAIPIDNNETEQLMKQVALGRKNCLFVGSVAAGYRAADLMTLVSSAIRNDLDVWAYVKGVLDALLSRSTDYAFMSLPTELQWEYAGRGGTEFHFAVGDSEDDLSNVGWYAENSNGVSQMVAQKPANQFGLYDMIGNVREWCLDTSGPLPTADAVDWFYKGHSAVRTIRGGSFESQFKEEFEAMPLCSARRRSYHGMSFRSSSLGFRVCLISR